MSANFHRGFFRIWIALSAIWVFAVLAIMGYKVFETRNAARVYSYSVQLDQLAESGTNAAANFPEKFVTMWQVPDSNLTINLPVPEPKGPFTIITDQDEDKYAALAKKYGGREVRNPGPWDDFRPLVPDNDLPGLAKRAKQMYAASLIAGIGAMVATAFIPPIVLLIVGMVLAWVARGFHVLASAEKREK